MVMMMVVVMMMGVIADHLGMSLAVAHRLLVIDQRHLKLFSRLNRDCSALRVTSAQLNHVHDGF